MMFDTTFLIDYEREVKRSRPGMANAFLVQQVEAGVLACRRADASRPAD